LAEGEKLTCHPISVFAMGKSLLDGFAIEMTAVLKPGEVRSRPLGGLDVTIKGLGIHDTGLAGGIVIDGVD
jgi:hypothetical protein